MKKIIIGFSLIFVLLLSACGEPTWQEKYDLGIRYFSEGNYEEAVIAFTAAIEIEPKNAEAYIGLADTYINMGDWEKAQESLINGLEEAEDEESLRDKLSDMQCEIGEKHLEQGEYEEAIKDFQDALDYNPDNKAAKKGLADAFEGSGEEHLAQGDYEEAEKDFRAALEIDPEREDAHLGLSDALMEMGELEGAIDALRDALEVLDNPGEALRDRLDELESLKKALDALMDTFSAENLDDVFQEESIKDILDILNKYMDRCYDGKRFIKNYTGVGYKMLMENFIYYGDLINGEPNGKGDGICPVELYDHYTGSWSNGKPNGEGSEITVGAGFRSLDIGTYIDGIGNGSVQHTLFYTAGAYTGEYVVFQFTVEDGYVVDGNVPIEISSGLPRHWASVPWDWGRTVYVKGFEE